MIMLHLHKLINIFHYDHSEKLKTIFAPIDSAPPMVRPIIKLGVEVSSTKKKLGQPTKANDTSKYTKKS